MIYDKYRGKNTGPQCVKIVCVLDERALFNFKKWVVDVVNVTGTVRSKLH
jgi:hypothetical protein